MIFAGLKFPFGPKPVIQFATGGGQGSELFLI